MSVTINGERFPTERSTRKHKKLASTLPSGVKVHYGDTLYQNWGKSKGAKFLPKVMLHFDEDRRKSYLARHAETSQKKYSPSYFAKEVLW